MKQIFGGCGGSQTKLPFNSEEQQEPKSRAKSTVAIIQGITQEQSRTLEVWWLWPDSCRARPHHSRPPSVLLPSPGDKRCIAAAGTSKRQHEHEGDRLERRERCTHQDKGRQRCLFTAAVPPSPAPCHLLGVTERSVCVCLDFGRFGSFSP